MLNRLNWEAAGRFCKIWAQAWPWPAAASLACAHFPPAVSMNTMGKEVSPGARPHSTGHRQRMQQQLSAIYHSWHKISYSFMQLCVSACPVILKFGYPCQRRVKPPSEDIILDVLAMKPLYMIWLYDTPSKECTPRCICWEHQLLLIPHAWTYETSNLNNASHTCCRSVSVFAFINLSFTVTVNLLSLNP